MLAACRRRERSAGRRPFWVRSWALGVANAAQNAAIGGPALLTALVWQVLQTFGSVLVARELRHTSVFGIVRGLASGKFGTAWGSSSDRSCRPAPRRSAPAAASAAAVRSECRSRNTSRRAAHR
ncbi:hypothetical protein NUM_70980 [Actinocatenispora comari]|uniref:Uncharacterized protein n=1 Tax=Actinocatenispora comari TaxID=2807577 RepID=A0A8J4ACS0_9ACTN|nr:hypothetical protein NUM_44550 [Actinocatenispora comari]GIL31844.1 hypothetical protein NUM_70980 [Actinocatenispora comari]